MAKLTLNDVSNLTGAEQTAITTINDNWDSIVAALENTLSRDGTTPNSMSADLDLNTNDLLNVGTIGSVTGTFSGTLTASIGSFTRLIINGTEVSPTGVPSGGTTGQFLTKNSDDDYDVSWATVAGTGTVTSVALSGSNGITVTGTSPITTSGSWALSIDAATLRTHLNVADGADVSPVASVNGNTGTVVLDPDDLDDTSTTNKFASAANVQAAGALMDSEVTNLAQVKAFDSSDYAADSHTHDHTDITDYDTELAGKTNTTAFTPTADYHPATKKYVDDEIVGAGGYNDESAQDAIGTILVDSSEIDFTYNDATPSITASIVASSIDESKLDASVNASLDLADSAQQPPSEGAFVNGDKTKLDDIEANADVTDTANVTAAGAVMDSELASETHVKALDQSVISGASPTFSTANMTDATNKRFMTDAQETVLDAQSGTNTGDESTATTSAEGIVELSTAAEYRNDTAGAKALTPEFVWDAAAEVTLTDAASITVDMDSFINATVTLGGNRTLANPTNAKVGQTGFIRVVQDGTGSRTLAYGSNYEFAGGTAPTLTTTASAEDILFYVVISSTRIVVSSILDIS